MTVRLAIRGFYRRILVFEEQFSIEEPSLDEVLPNLAKEHATAVTNGVLDMIELELLDENDKNQRYFRIGTNPDGMARPIGVDLSSLPDQPKESP